MPTAVRHTDAAHAGARWHGGNAGEDRRCARGLGDAAQPYGGVAALPRPATPRGYYRGNRQPRLARAAIRAAALSRRARVPVAARPFPSTRPAGALAGGDRSAPASKRGHRGLRLALAA